MTRHQKKNEADGVRGREDAIGSATARGGENRAGTRAVRTNRSSFELPRRSRPGTRDREHRSPPPGVPENPTGTRARFGTAGTRVFKMARGSTGPSPLPARGSGCREAARAAGRPRVERASGGWIHRTRRATNPEAARLVQIAPDRVAFDDPIATCLVPRDRFWGDARTKARARTFSALCRRAVARGFTRFGRRVDEREFLSCRSRADRCGRCGDRWRLASALASGETYILRAFCEFFRLPIGPFRHRVPAFPPVSSSRRILNSCAPLVSSRFLSGRDSNSEIVRPQRTV